MRSKEKRAADGRLFFCFVGEGEFRRHGQDTARLGVLLCHWEMKPPE